MSDWSFAGYQRAETLPLTIFHVASEIHAFSLASCAFVFWTALRKAAEILSSLIGVVGGWRGPPRYLECPLGGNSGPYNGPSYSWGPVLIHSKRDGDPSRGCSKSNTSPTSLPRSCSMYSRPSTMSAGKVGSALPTGSWWRWAQTVRQPPPQNAVPVGKTLPLRRGVGLSRPLWQRCNHTTRRCRFCQ